MLEFIHKERMYLISKQVLKALKMHKCLWQVQPLNLHRFVHQKHLIVLMAILVLQLEKKVDSSSNSPSL